MLGVSRGLFLSVEPLLVRRVAPWLAVARYEVNWILDAGDSALRFDQLDALLEEPLPAASEEQRAMTSSRRRSQRGSTRSRLA